MKVSEIQSYFSLFPIAYVSSAKDNGVTRAESPVLHSVCLFQTDFKHPA